MPRNLLAIIVIQAIILAGVARGVRQMTGRRVSAITWLLALGVGAGFGALMDVMLGMSGVFAYFLNGSACPPVEPRKMPVMVLVVNALASYGLASVTVATVVPWFISNQPSAPKWKSIFALALAAGMLGVIALPRGSLGILFAWGFMIISAGELALSARGKTGPILALLAMKDVRPLVRMGLFCAGIGAAYEATNLVFPFWVWLPGSSLSPTAVTCLIVAVGYIALFHPIAVMLGLLGGKPGETE